MNQIYLMFVDFITLMGKATDWELQLQESSLWLSCGERINQNGFGFTYSSLVTKISAVSADSISVVASYSMYCQLLSDGLGGPLWLLSTVASK